MMRTSNPMLNEKAFQSAHAEASAGTMTLSGTVNRTGLLLLALVLAAGYTWTRFLDGGMAAAGPLMIGGLIGGLVFCLLTIFVKTWASVTALPYAVCEGLFLGGISGVFESQYPGIALQAVGLTFGTLFALLAAYSTGLIKPSENFKLGIVAATGAICLFYVASMVLGMFGISVPLIHGSGPIGIAFSLFVVAIAALNLVLDFDFIENGVANGAPKYMEWFAAFGLVVTLVWLYIEILHLLAKLNRR